MTTAALRWPTARCAAGASSTTPVVVKADAGGEPLAGVTQIAAGRNATCALITGGTVRCWGLQTTGRLGNGLTASANVLTPTEVLTADATPLTGVTRISMHEANACAVLANNTVRCWGEGSSNQIGDNLSTARAYATEVASITTATDVQVGADSACALASSATARPSTDQRRERSAGCRAACSRSPRAAITPVH